MQFEKEIPRVNRTYSPVEDQKSQHLSYSEILFDFCCIRFKFYKNILLSKNRSTEGCSKLKSPETRQVQEILVSTLEHLQAPKWDQCPKLLTYFFL